MGRRLENFSEKIWSDRIMRERKQATTTKKVNKSATATKSKYIMGKKSLSGTLDHLFVPVSGVYFTQRGLLT